MTFYFQGPVNVEDWRMKMATLAEQAEKLLDFNQKLDIQLLDNIVSYMYTADGQQVVCVKVI